MGKCRCAAELAPAPAGDGVVRVRREVRNGKPVTVVLGVPGDDAARKALAQQCKQRCGAGGSVKDGQIEIQGDHRDTVAELLRALGHTVRLAGG